MPLARTLLRIVGLVLALPISIAALFILALIFSTPPDPFAYVTSKGAVRWASTSGEPIPDEFLYLMFPPAGGATVLDAAGRPLPSAPPLTRALINQHRELTLTTMPLAGTSVGASIAADQLSFWPADPTQRSAAVTQMIADRRAAGVAGFDLRATSLPQPDGSLLTTVILHRDMFIDLFEYRLTPTNPPTPQPLRWINTNDRIRALDLDHALPLFFRLCAIAAAGSGLLALTVLLRRAKISSRRSC